jgi:osmotically-inducible protein OsmY
MEEKTMRIRSAWSLAILVPSLCIVMSCAATDTGITTNVKTRLAMDDLVKASQIEVTTKDGRVTLTGNVDSEQVKIQALKLARATNGVVEVVDLISSRRASGGGDAPGTDRTLGGVVQDSGITMSVKQQLLGDPLVKGLRIDVDTREGIVFLTGSVSSDVERQKAIQLARDTNGVRDVKANLTISKS